MSNIIEKVLPKANIVDIDSKFEYYITRAHDPSVAYSLQDVIHTFYLPYINTKYQSSKTQKYHSRFWTIFSFKKEGVEYETSIIFNFIPKFFLEHLGYKYFSFLFEIHFTARWTWCYWRWNGTHIGCEITSPPRVFSCSRKYRAIRAS